MRPTRAPRLAPATEKKDFVDGLRANGDNTFSATAASGNPAAAGVRVAQGVLEASNVDVADAMADMIEAQRSFELASRAIRMQDQLLEIANGVKR